MSFNPLLQCHVIKNGIDCRAILDITGIHSLAYQRYKCNTHQENLTATSPEVVDELCKQYTPSVSFISGPRLTYTTRLACFVFNSMPQVGFNFARVKKILVLNWITNNGMSDRTVSLSSYSIKNMYIAYWNLIKSQVETAQKKLNTNSGTVLRGDHTYKIVKNLSAHNHNESKRVCCRIVVMYF